MSRIETATEAMEHIASVVDGVATVILDETNKLVKTINSIQEKANREIKKSDRAITEYQRKINALVEQIESYRSMKDENHNYQEQIADCRQQIEELRNLLRKEISRNNELRQTLSKFRQQSAQALKTLKQTNLAAGNAAVNGKRYIARKIDIITYGYEDTIAGAAVLGAGPTLSRGGNGESEEEGEYRSEQDNFAVMSFGNDLGAALSWGAQAFRDWNNSLNISERQAFIDYKKELFPHESSYYVNINNTLRGKDTFREGNQMRYIRMHNALRRSEVPSDVTAYRGISRDAFNSLIENAHTSGFDGLRDNGFMSCSLVGDNLFCNTSEVILKLTIPEGTRGAFIADMGNMLVDECELLLDCGSSVFITKVYDAPRSTITEFPGNDDIITIVEGVVEN